MILTENDLREWEESIFIQITAAQKQAIMDRFGMEPAPYEWSEQDITVQIGNFLGCGKFEKTMIGNGNGTELPPGVEF